MVVVVVAMVVVADSAAVAGTGASVVVEAVATEVAHAMEGVETEARLAGGRYWQWCCDGLMCLDAAHAMACSVLWRAPVAVAFCLLQRDAVACVSFRLN